MHAIRDTMEAEGGDPGEFDRAEGAAILALLDRTAAQTSLERIKAAARGQGFIVETDKSGRQFLFTVRDAITGETPAVKTDRGGLEAFILGGMDEYLYYLQAEALRQGFVVEADRSGGRFPFIIRDTKIKTNPAIRTDRRGLEAFILGGMDEYLYYCESAGIEPFTDRQK